MRQKGFTLAELLIAIMILGILAGTMTLNPGAARQSARKEAEKVAALFSSAVMRADKDNLSFDAEITTNTISIDWHGNEPQHMMNNPLKASTGCNYDFTTRYPTTSTKFTYAKMNYPNSVWITTVKTAPTKKYNGLNVITVTDGKGAHFVQISGDYVIRQ